MNCISATLFGNFYNFINVQVTFARWSFTYTISFVGVTHMKRSPVCFRVNGNRFKIKLPAGSHNANRNFAPVCD